MSSWSREPAPWTSGRGCSSTTSNCGATPGCRCCPSPCSCAVGLDGIGWDAYEEHFWEQRIVRFEYAYVGLPALDGEQYATGENLLGVALAP